MVRFGRILTSEWLKTRRTPLRWLALLTPLILTIFLLWYLSQTAMLSKIQILAFQFLFEAWTTLVIPGGAGLAAALMAQQEEQAGQFTGFLADCTPRWKLFMGKLILLIGFSAISTILAALGVAGGLKYGLAIHESISWNLFLLGAALSIVGALPLLAAHLWVSLAWGKGASIGLGAAGVLVAALIGATSLGDGFWAFVPWAWAVRLSRLPGLFMPGNDLPSGINAAALFWRQALSGGIPAAIALLGLTFGGIAWFARWEGRAVFDA